MSAVADRPASAAPERSFQQRMDALQEANRIRTARAGIKRNVKRDLAAGRIRVEGLLLEPPQEILTMKLFDLLLATPRWGRVKVNKTLGRCRISPSKTVGGLSERQRREVVAWMRRH